MNVRSLPLDRLLNLLLDNILQSRDDSLFTHIQVVGESRAQNVIKRLKFFVLKSCHNSEAALCVHNSILRRERGLRNKLGLIFLP